MTNPQETQSITAAVPGVQATVGPLEVNDLAIVSAGDAGTGGTPSPDAPGRFTGSLYNTSSSLVTATLSTQSSNRVDVTVPPSGQILLVHPERPPAQVHVDERRLDRRPGRLRPRHRRLRLLCGQFRPLQQHLRGPSAA